MIARTNLTANMGALSTSLERLSTGFRINSGKDDPAGLIASEMLRSDITGIKKAVQNTERANMMIATADSALNQVTSLLNDIRGLITEAASTGTMSAEMIRANQLQVDKSLDAIDRIAAQTTFMGKKLLDGTLDFDLQGINRNDLSGLAVHEVIFGATKSPVTVNVAVREPAERAALYYQNPALSDDISLTWGGNYGYQTQTFSRGATTAEIAERINATSDSTGVVAEVGSDAIQGTIITSSLGTNNDIIITAGSAGTNAGNVEIKYLKGDSKGVRIEYQEPIEEGAPAKMLVYLQTSEEIAAFADDVDNTAGVHDNNALKFIANIEGAQYNNSSIQYVDGNFTQAAFGNAATNPTEQESMPYAYYNDLATNAKALFGEINGLNNFGSLTGTGQYFAIQSKATGVDYNNTEIIFRKGTAGDGNIPTGKKAAAVYNAETKQLNIYVGTSGTSQATLQDVKDALQLEGHFELQPSTTDLLSHKLTSTDTYPPSIASQFDPLNPSTAVYGYSNTHNSGGDAGTLFIVLPTDGQFPTYPEGTVPGVTDVALANSASTTAVKFSLKSADSSWDGYKIKFANDSSGSGANSITDITLDTTDLDHPTITIKIDGSVSYDAILSALNSDDWTKGTNGYTTGATKPSGLGQLEWSNEKGVPATPLATTKITGTFADNKELVFPDPPVKRAITANDILKLFDLNSQTGNHLMSSKGSERAASLFTVERTTDNDGTGLINAWRYQVTGQDTTTDITDDTYARTATSFNKIFQNGQSGGDIVTTAAELVTALNNSAYWGQSMCPEMLVELSAFNANGQYFDVTNPPPILARLAPGNHGLFTVSSFEEVAYYGDPNDGTALQFLGEENSPDIRFIADSSATEIWAERTTVPDTVDFAQAVLSAENKSASMVIVANQKGEAYDDMQFVFKRVSESVQSASSIDRKDGWVEYDPEVSRAEAQATFKDASGNSIANSAFFITATERGDLYNNVDMVMTLADVQSEKVKVTFDDTSKQLRISINNADAGNITANDVIAAINAADVGFKAELSFAQQTTNDGTGKIGSDIGLKVGQQTRITSTGDTGGHTGGTVTVWMTDQEVDTVDPATGLTVKTYREPTAEDATRLIRADQVVGRMFSARNYSTGADSGTGTLDFVNDGPIVTSGGLVERGVLTIHFPVDSGGNIATTAKELADWWDLQDPATVGNISASIVRPPGAQWDECNDPYGYGKLKPTVEIGECNELIVNDIKFVGWNDAVEKQEYVPKYATGTMTSDNGINSSYTLTALRLGSEYNGYTIQYVNDPAVSGYYNDNYVVGSDGNPCDDDVWSGLKVDDYGNPIVPQTYSNNGMYLELDTNAKIITLHVREGITTTNDIEQLIESDPYTRNLFKIDQLGTGSGVISLEDNTLLTKDGAIPPGELNGAKLLFGSDATDYYLMFKSLEYGSDKFVNVVAEGINGTTAFKLYDSAGNVMEKDYGRDVDATINGIAAVGGGLGVSLNTATISMDFVMSEAAATTAGYGTTFVVTGGGATFQVGPDVVSNQQINLGIQSVNTAILGGASGKLYQLYSGHDASLTGDTNMAFRIVEEALLAITETRGRLGTLQKATFESNVSVLNDTLEALMSAESLIRDTDFAEETAALTRAQILVQSNISTLGIANQIPNYMLGLIGG
jgi:flagellin-like hook-associated protein FlgL